MAQIKFIPIPAEDYDALGINADTILETRVTNDGALIIRAVTDEDLEEFVCDGDCCSCPVADTDCDGDCFSCPCYACCDDSDYDGECRLHKHNPICEQTGRDKECDEYE